MTLHAFVRCGRCGLPHEASRTRCPFTNEPIGNPRPAAEPTPEAEPSLSLEGELVSGKYEVGGLLGEGAMGSVYEAHDVRSGRAVALKVLHAQLRGARRAKDRFVREAQAAARVSHPNVIQVYDAGTSGERGLPFIAMELVRGETLGERLLEQPRLPEAEAVGVAVRLLAGLAAAHAVGVVHRDVKPDNVLLCAGDHGGVKILDFGVAKMLSAMTRYTATGEVLGTPAYLAPEQARGRTVDGRTDAWAASVVLYEALAGRLPFEGDDLGTIVGAILEDEPPPLEALRPELSAPVVAAVRAGLHKDPEQRPTVDVLARRLKGAPG